ncbi:MAG: hypothetical protein MK105_08570 [Crocinitomicaceae bacterium]|nr:hypothetical protein [Crocinitomicaceae bacterium]
MKYLLSIIILGLGLITFAQDNLYISFVPKCGGSDFVLGSTVQDLNGVDFVVDDFNYYISNLQVVYDGGQILDLSDTVLLVKADAHTFLLNQVDLPNIEQVNFSVGVPQNLNHTDISLYPIDHFLSFQTPSMHWGWTAGYKLLLVDGMGDFSGDGIPETIFQLHNLGDINFKNVQLPTVATYGNGQTDIVVHCHLDEWLYGINPATVGVVHGETGVNSQTMDNVDNRAVFTSPANASMNEVGNVGNLYFVNKSNSISITWKDMTRIDSYKMIDVSGKVILSSNTDSIHETIIVENMNKGAFIFNTYDVNGNVLNSIKMVH